MSEAVLRSQPIRVLAVGSAIFLCAAASAIIAPRPVRQNQSYHRFIDTRALAGIPNAADVVSNALFVLAGSAGLFARRKTITPEVRLLCFGLMLTGIGSSIYHLSPSDRTLATDRLGMIVVIAAYIALLLDEFDVAAAADSLPLVLNTSVATIVWWMAFDDLRPYLLLQFTPIALFVGGACVSRPLPDRWRLWVATAGYVVAKVVESFDGEIYATTRFVSGHTLKHVIAAGALWIVVDWARNRNPRVLRETATCSPARDRASRSS